MLLQAKASPDINNYLAYIASGPEPPPGTNLSMNDWNVVRSSSALMLKNNIKSNYKQIPPESVTFIKIALLAGLQDQHSHIRNLVGVAATELIKRGNLVGWPELLPTLMGMMTNETATFSESAQVGAVSTLATICEDNPTMLERELNGQRPLNFVLPKLIEATKSPLPKVRSDALRAINVFVPRKSQAMLNSIDVLLQHLFVLASDQDISVRLQVCKAFVRLVDARPDKLEPHLSGLIDYILTQQKSDDEDLALEASEFWLSVGEHDDLWKGLDPYIHKIIPTLLECMVYSGEDIALLGGESDDDEEEDRVQDIKPTFAKSSSAKKMAHVVEKNGSKMEGTGMEGTGMDEDGLEEGEIDEDGDIEERWTIRKGSAAALDVFARDFKGRVFECVLPFLTSNLKHEDWPHREAAVLALGAVSEGCMSTVAPHLPELVPYLITLLGDSEVVVRQITCWTLSRYSSWAAGLVDAAQKQAYFEPMVDGLLQRMLDKNKKVQAAAASAVANLIETAGPALQPYAGHLTQQFILCFEKYKDKNMYILYDCVQMLAEKTSAWLARTENHGQLMKALTDRYQAISDQSRELLPLFECLSCVAVALGQEFAPYAKPMFHRCVNIIHNSLESNMAAESNPDLDKTEKDFLVTSLDLLAAIIQAVAGSGATELVTEQGRPFFELLGFCLEDPEDDSVRQSAYALLGDCARHVFPQLQPYVDDIIRMIIIKQLDLDAILDDDFDQAFAVISNACWAAGEIAMQYKTGMAPFVPEFLKYLVDILTNPRVQPVLAENAAITLGRLGLDNAELLAPHLGTFAQDFMSTMENVTWMAEKETAFKGFTLIVAQNPQAMEKSLLDFFISIARYQGGQTPRTELHRDLHNVFQHVRLLIAT